MKTNYIRMRIGKKILWIATIVIVIVASFFFLNSAIKATNGYKNDYIYSYQILDDWQNHISHNIKYNVINLGSNPALHAFEYDLIENGRNWATGSQGPDMDLAILEEFHTSLSDSCIVFVPLCIFSSCSPYLAKYNPNYNPLSYPARLGLMTKWNNHYRNYLPNWDKSKLYFEFPLLYNWRSVKYCISDINRRSIDSYQLRTTELMEKDADLRIKAWKEEFGISNLHGPISDSLRTCINVCVDKFIRIIDFCDCHNFRPIIVVPPIPQVLHERYDSIAADIFIYSFLNKIKRKRNVQCLDYLNDKQLSDNKYYKDALFLNKTGRQAFSRRILTDTGILRK